MIKSLRISAIIPSTNIDKTKKFLIETLNFENLALTVKNEDYAIVKTADTELHIQSSKSTPNEMSLYLLVENVDNAWENIKNVKDIKAKAPFIQDYGMKEVHVILPHTNALLFIGEDLG